MSKKIKIKPTAKACPQCGGLVVVIAHAILGEFVVNGAGLPADTLRAFTTEVDGARVLNAPDALCVLCGWRKDADPQWRGALIGDLPTATYLAANGHTAHTACYACADANTRPTRFAITENDLRVYCDACRPDGEARALPMPNAEVSE
jgi:hypothetical protein